MSKWKWVFVAVGASLLMYGCAAGTPPASPTEAAQTKTEAEQTESAQTEHAQTEPGQMQADTAQAKELFENRNPSIGDAVADGKLVEAVKKQYRITESNTIELQTAQEPYELILHFDQAPDQACMKRSAIVLLSLIDNSGIVSWDYPDASGIRTAFSMDVKAASHMAGADDIKAYSQSEEKVGELLSLINKASAVSAEQEQESMTGTKAPTAQAQEPAVNSGGG